jgi:uncharacterized protein YwlG (UPF0340 family)
MHARHWSKSITCVFDTSITHKKCTLLKMAASEAAGSRFARVDEEEINQIIEDAIPKSTKRQTRWSIAIFKERN